MSARLFDHGGWLKMNLSWITDCAVRSRGACSPWMAVIMLISSRIKADKSNRVFFQTILNPGSKFIRPLIIT